MKFICCVICLSAISLTFVQAKGKRYLHCGFRKNDCIQLMGQCADLIGMKVFEGEITGLCNGEPQATTSTKCLMDCHMQQYHWTDNEGTFKKDKYLTFMKQTELGRNETYVQAAEKAADICKDTKASFDDSCETAYLLLKCLQDEGNKLQQMNIGYSLFYVNPHFFDFDALLEDNHFLSPLRRRRRF